MLSPGRDSVLGACRCMLQAANNVERKLGSGPLSLLAMLQHL